MPLKTCAFNCVYCQLGHTRVHTTERKAYAATVDVLRELERVLEHIERPDAVTLSGSGEPTLHAELDAIIQGIRRLTDVPVAILTSGALLFEPDVRAACAKADVVLPTLAAHTEALYRRIHRPAPGLTLERHISGIAALRTESATPIWLELFLLEGVNAGEEDLAAFAPLIARIDPQRVQINTAVRPPQERFALSVAPEKLRRWARELGPRAEVIAARPARRPGRAPVEDADILALCRRHPCTLRSIADALATQPRQVRAHIDRLIADRLLIVQERDQQQFYLAPELAHGGPSG